MQFLSFTWNPTEGIDLGFYTIQYYSLMFVISFILGWFIMKKIFKNEGESLEKLDSLFIYMVLAILLGARLGHVLFYQSELITQDPLSIILPISTQGGIHFTGFRGLASHGAAIGVIIAMFMYNKKVLKKPILWIFDRIIIPVAVGSVFVRFGNFMNSEIIGKPTTEGNPFGVRFIRNFFNFSSAEKDPTRITSIKDVDKAYNALASNPEFADALATAPFSHPAQLYEAAGYVLVFLILWYVYWKTDKRNMRGFIFGLFLVLFWSVRFVVEYYKKSQGGFEDMLGTIFSTGQWLSIPLIIAGIYFMTTSSKKKTA